jgi:hypothetical protein
MQQTMPLLSRARQQAVTNIFSAVYLLLDGAGVEEVVLVLVELLESDLVLDDSDLDSAFDSVLDSDPFFGDAAPPLERA